ncbi:MAG TPA: hypothetical protein VLG50_03915 [Candidatus Saccharimonadales bacterium]|nr:hypothetical protein [Candidatus Saccharimonadales bacterium]
MKLKYRALTLIAVSSLTLLAPSKTVEQFNNCLATFKRTESELVQEGSLEATFKSIGALALLAEAMTALQNDEMVTAVEKSACKAELSKFIETK